MATDIFDRSVSDHVVFDRIVDVDRTITLARQAADEAEKRGQPDKAAKLREKADYLEEILNNTQNPDYSDEEEGTPPEQSDGGEGTGKDKASDQGKKSDTDDNGANAGEEEQDEDEGSGSGAGEEKQPEDIDNLDQNNSKHASGTNRHQGGGPSDSGDGDGSQGSGTNNPQNQGKGQGKGQGQNQELDPFRVSSSRQQGNQKQPTKEEILAAIIKKLSGLTGEARKGADRALQDYFNNVSGGGTL
jgi:hypothetical protein